MTTENNKELAVVKKITPMIDEINNFEISEAKDMTKATEYLSQCNKFLDGVVADREKITKPLNATLKEVRARYKPTENMLNGAITSLRSEISTYQTDMLKKKQEESAKIAARIGAGKGKLKLETAVNKMSDIETPEESIETDSGTLKFRSDKKLKVVDLTAIPQKYFDLNESRTLKALKEGEKITGAEIEIVQTPINSR